MEKYHERGRDVDEVRLLWAALQEYIQEALLVVLRCLYMASEPLIFNECNAFHHKLRHFASVKIVLYYLLQYTMRSSFASRVI
jgi:hypothetical protein